MSETNEDAGREARSVRQQFCGSPSVLCRNFCYTSGVNILVFGDSITWGAWDIEGGWASRLKKYNDSKVISSNLEIYNSIYNLGVSGDTSVDLLNRIENEVTSRLDQDDDNIVIIAIGTNDSQFSFKENINKVSLEDFRENLLKITEIADRLNVKVVFIGLFPVDDLKVNPIPWKPTYSYSNEQIDKYNRAISKFADTRELTFIELYTQAMNLEYRSFLFDGLHPNEAGHLFIFEVIKNQLIKEGLLE